MLIVDGYAAIFLSPVSGYPETSTHAHIAAYSSPDVQLSAIDTESALTHFVAGMLKEEYKL